MLLLTTPFALIVSFFFFYGFNNQSLQGKLLSRFLRYFALFLVGLGLLGLSFLHIFLAGETKLWLAVFIMIFLCCAFVIHRFKKPSVAAAILALFILFVFLQSSLLLKARMDSSLKASLSKLGNVLQRRITGLAIHDISCTLRAYQRACLADLALDWEGQHRFVPLLLFRKGHRIGEIVAHHRKRKFGVSKYSHSRIGKVTIDFLKVSLEKQERKNQ